MKYSTAMRARFMAKVQKLEDGCWKWAGAVQDSNDWRASYSHGADTPNLRGRFHMNGRTEYAHRAAWLLFRGPVPAGQVVRHVRCQETLCVNPAHLAIGTHEDNAADRANATTATDWMWSNWK